MAKKFILLVLSLFLFLLFFHRGIETEDVWLHLSIGQWMVAHLQIPHIDEFPFASEKTPYICHEWLASSLIFLAYKIGAFTGLKIFRSLFFVLSIAIFFGFSYRRLPFSLLIFLTLMMSYALFQRCLLRPDTFNLLFIQLFLLGLFSYERNGGRWKLFLLPLIGVVWINLHLMGAFIYGGSILSAFFVSSLVRKNKGQSKELGLVFLVFLSSFMINPYGLEGFLFPYRVLLFPKFYGFYKMIGITGELQYPAYIFFSSNYFYYILLIIFPILLLFLNKKSDHTLNLLFALALTAFFYMSRNSSFFALVAAYVIVLGAQNIGIKGYWERQRWSSLIDRALLGGVVLCLIIQIFGLLNESVYFNGKKYRALFLETNPYVTSTIDLLQKNGIAGPVFNCTLLGGAIIWYDYPSLRPFDDGRHLDYQRFNDAICVLLDPPKNWHRVEGHYGLNVVVLSEGYDLERRVINYLGTQKDWQLIAVNGPFVVYVKKGSFHLPYKLDQFEQRLKSGILLEKDVDQLKIYLRAQQRSGIKRFLEPSPLKVDFFSNGVTLMNLGYNAAAAKDFIEALKISDQTYMKTIVRSFLEQLK